MSTASCSKVARPTPVLGPVSPIAEVKRLIREGAADEAGAGTTRGLGPVSPIGEVRFVSVTAAYEAGAGPTRGLGPVSPIEEVRIVSVTAADEAGAGLTRGLGPVPPLICEAAADRVGFFFVAVFGLVPVALPFALLLNDG